MLYIRFLTLEVGLFLVIVVCASCMCFSCLFAFGVTIIYNDIMCVCSYGADVIMWCCCISGDTKKGESHRSFQLLHLHCHTYDRG